jgi:pimeloyl-ACP methyl ester carboxylesterase
VPRLPPSTTAPVRRGRARNALAPGAAAGDDTRVGLARRAAVAITAGVTAAGIASAAYQRAAGAADRRRFPPPGRLVDVGGRRLHLLAMGEGTPAVVIVPALGSNVLEWVRVLRGASSETTVCAYDRAGLGWSDPRHGTAGLDAMADDLHALLKAADIAPPYVIAGNSMGGIIARRFQARYPEDVTGMLLIDSSHEDQARRLGDRAWDGLFRAAKRQLRILGLRRIGAHLGLIGDLDAAILAWETVPEYEGAAKALTLSTKERRAVAREMLVLGRPQGQPQDLGALPLTVLSAGSESRRKWPIWAPWAQLQDEMAALSSDSAYMYAVNAGHNVHLDDPGVVVQAVLDLIERCRGAGT